MEFKTVFGPGTGGPSDYYRIPSIITTKNGVVVACADARFFTGADNPNRIDKVVRRSMDLGETMSANAVLQLHTAKTAVKAGEISLTTKIYLNLYAKARLLKSKMPKSPMLFS